MVFECFNLFKIGMFLPVGIRCLRPLCDSYSTLILCKTKLSYFTTKSQHVVDLRSDCLSKPTTGMKQAMFEASDGDDVFNEDTDVLSKIFNFNTYIEFNCNL